MGQRWVAAAVLLFVGCKRAELPLDCDPAAMTKEWAFATFAMHTGSRQVADIDIQHDDLDWTERGDGVFDLGADVCCDIPHLEIARYWHCNLYEDSDALAHDMLVDHGWAAAAGARRAELANAVDKVLTDRLEIQPSSWNQAKPFTAPAAEPLPDGGVRLRRWVRELEGGGQSAPTESFELVELRVTADARRTDYKRSERYEAAGAAPRPATGPAGVPPER